MRRMIERYENSGTVSTAHKILKTSSATDYRPRQLATQGTDEEEGVAITSIGI